MRDPVLRQLDKAYNYFESSSLPQPAKVFAYILIFTAHVVYDMAARPEHQ
jgi:hypothetical protein